MPSYSPKPSSGGRTSTTPINLGGRRFEAPRMSQKKEGYQVGIQSSTTGSRSRVSVVGGVNSTSGADSLVTTNNTHYLNIASTSSQCAFINDADQTGLDITGDFSIAFWANFQGTQSTGNKFIYAKHLASNGERGIALFFNLDGTPDRLTVQISQNDATTSASYWEVNVGALRSGWKHYLVTCDVSNGLSTKFELFIDNVSLGNGTTSGGNATAINNNSQPAVIGAAASDGTSAIDVRLDSFKIYNVVKDNDDVFEYSTSETLDSNLVAFWKFDNNYLDQTTNNNDLTALNSPTFGTDALFNVYGLLEKVSPTMDGEVVRGVQLGFRSTTWTVIHGATTGDSDDANTSNDDMRASIERGQAGANTWIVYRAFMSYFVPITIGPYIQCSFISLRKETDDVDVGFELGLTAATPASDTTLVPEDFDQCGDINSPVEFADRVDYSASRGLLWFTLNSTGIDALLASIGDYFVVGVRVADDYSDTIPAHTGSQRSMIDINTVEFATEYLRPWLGIVKGEV